MLLLSSNCCLATAGIFLVKAGIKWLIGRRWRRAQPAASFALDLLIPTQLLGTAAGIGLMALHLLGDL